MHSGIRIAACFSGFFSPIRSFVYFLNFSIVFLLWSSLSNMSKLIWLKHRFKSTSGLWTLIELFITNRISGNWLWNFNFNSLNTSHWRKCYDFCVWCRRPIHRTKRIFGQSTERKLNSLPLRIVRIIWRYFFSLTLKYLIQPQFKLTPFELWFLFKSNRLFRVFIFYLKTSYNIILNL